MAEIGYVILHYKTFDLTRNCVESIMRSSKNSPIVIVDNGSGDGSGEKLADLYQGMTGITLLKLEKNLGFARGNNEGIRYVRSTYNVSFVVVLNNDTILEQEQFEEIIKDEFYNSGFAVLGPQVTTADGAITSNPVEYIVDTRSKTYILLLKRYIKLFINQLHLNFLVKNAGEDVKHIGVYDNTKRYENVKLHGCCWVFSEKYFEHFDGLNESTFLYFEEDILYNELLNRGLLMVYNPELKIIHLEDGATNSLAKTSRKKNIFVLKNEIRSLKVLLKILKE